MGRGSTRAIIPWTTIQSEDKEDITPGIALQSYNAAVRRLKEVGREDEIPNLQYDLRVATSAVIENYVHVKGTGYTPEDQSEWPDLTPS